MSRVPISAAVLSLTMFLACTVKREEALPAEPEKSSQCTRNTLSRALAIDTTRLTRRDYQDVVSETSEGMLLSVYQDSSARVLVATYFGESGKTVDRNYISSPTDFAVVHSEIHYSRPIYDQSAPQIAAQKQQTRPSISAGSARSDKWILLLPIH